MDGDLDSLLHASILACTMDYDSGNNYSEVGVDAADVMKGFTIDANSCYGQAAGSAQSASNNKKHACSKIALVILYIIVIALLLALVGACIAFTMEISNIKSETASFQTAPSLQGSQNALVSRIEDLMQQCLELKTAVVTTAIHSNESYSAYLQLNHTIQQLRVQLSQGFSAIDGNIQLLNISIERINSTAIQSNESYSAYLQLNHTVQQLRVQLSQGFSAIDGNIQLLNVSIERINSSLGSGRHANVAVPSCAALSPSSPSGYYWVRASNGSPVRVYCDMTRSCGGVTGGWMRVAELDMTISSQECPSSLRERTDSNRRSCEVIGMCSTVNFDLQLLQYSRVCGKIQAYQVGSTDAFQIRQVGVASPTIEQRYVDGISLTHGHPRQHIWTFAAALDEVGTYPLGNCPCTNTNQAGSAGQPPAFVGSDYFCDTASTDAFVSNIFYGDDPLWDGAGCGPLNTCCSFNNPPWFFKQLLQPTTNNIEMRVCRDQLVNDENIAIEIIEIYVQ